MKGLLRIKKASAKGLNFAESNEQVDKYFSRLIKLIPGEILGLYAVGEGLIPVEMLNVLIAFAIICTVFLIIVRRKMTETEEKAPQRLAVFVSVVSFLLWLYSTSELFDRLGLQISWLGSILVMLWVFIVPYFYEGDEV